MAVSQADIDALNAAIASGERQVTLGSKSVTYQTTDSLIKARNDMRDELRATAGGARRPKQTVLVYGGRDH